MARDRSRYGLLVSGFGAIVLAVSVFLPWYGVSFTSEGLASVRAFGVQVASQLGDSGLQAQLSGPDAAAGPAPGEQIAALSAHQVLRDLNVVLLVLAGLAMLDALLPLARPASSIPDGAGGSVVLLGAIAAACVIFRMFDRPNPAEGLISLSLREGAWLALLGSLAMIVGGLWPRRGAVVPDDSAVEAAWRGLSGWSPGA
jgi:hypothetical protein